MCSRIIVAGGGGATGYGSGNGQNNGSAGGGITGSGTNAGGQIPNGYGTFGKGENGKTFPPPPGVLYKDNTYSGSGGGGYYGGAAGDGQQPIYTGKPGSGGSGFISGYSGCIAVKGPKDSTPSETSIHYSGYVFKDAVMKYGQREGNGIVIITEVM